MFKFNFVQEGEDHKQSDDVNHSEKVEWIQSREMFLSDIESFDKSDLFEIENLITCGNLNIYYYAVTPLLHLKNTEEYPLLNELENKHSDLLVGKYEGGFKIWECTFDLINFLAKNTETFKFSKTKVLDLGCGAGIVGLFCMLEGATVYFQDYNSEVLKLLTMPNVVLNKEKQIVNSDQKFFCGDWKSFCDLLINNEIKEDQKFDYIMTSETIYNTDNYGKLYNLFKQLLKANGRIFVSAKSHYFGVGGSTKEFIEYISREKIFQPDCVWECNEGIRRCILKVTFRNNE